MLFFFDNFFKYIGWSSVPSDTAILGYNLDCADIITNIFVNIFSGNLLEFNATELVPNSFYQFRLSVYNFVGTSPYRYYFYYLFFDY